MTDLPRHLGRQVDVETGWALVCSATNDGDPNVATLCGKPATWHIRWEQATTENGLACEEHLNFALSFNPHQVHSVENSACGMPGSWWVEQKPSHCTILALDEDPVRTGRAEVAA